MSTSLGQRHSAPDRTLLYVSLSFATGVAMWHWRGLSYLLLPLFLSCIVLLSRRVGLVAFCLLVTITAYFYTGYRADLLARHLPQESFVARALDEPAATDSGYWRGQVLLLEPGGGRYVLFCRRPWPGNGLITVTGAMAEPLVAKNPGEFDYAALLESQNVRGTVFASEIKVTGTYRTTFLQRARVSLAANLAILGERERGLAEAILLGDRRGMSSQEKDTWRKAGASHLLAVSGLHVSVMAGGLYAVLRSMLGRRSSLLFAMLAALAYALLIGSSVSAWRAALLFALYCLAGVALRKPHWPTSLAVVAAALLFIWPASIGDAGFQLSFAAYWGIMYLSPLFQGAFVSLRPKKLVTLFSASLCAQLATMPLVIHHFSALPIYGLLSGLFLIPLTPILLTCALAVALLSPLPLLGPAAAGLFSLAAWPFFKLTALLASLPGAAIAFLAAPPVLIGIYFAALYAIGSGRGRVRLRVGVCMAAAFVCLLLPEIMALRSTHVTFLSVGNADAIHIRVRGRHYMVDTADATAAERVVLPYLLSQGVRSLQGVVITHSHDDHVGGLPLLIGSLPVQSIYAGPELTRVMRLAQRPVLNAEAGLTISRGGYFSLSGRGLGDTSLNLNNRSVVVSLQLGDMVAFLAADLEKEGEAQFLPSLSPVHVLKVGHHGSSSSSTEPFLKALGPRVAIISVGRNRYGHPAATTLESLDSVGALVLRTDLDGAVRIVLRRGTMYVYTFQRNRFVLRQRMRLAQERVGAHDGYCELPQLVARPDAA